VLPGLDSQLPPPSDPILSVAERRQRQRSERNAANNLKIESQRSAYNPSSNPDATGDPYNTLFVSCLTDAVTEEEIRYELSPFGPIRAVMAGGISRRSTPSVKILEGMNCRKRKRTECRCGVRYRGTLTEVARRREENEIS
jgi:RNA recognition motif-containing protein